jgi:hypothetical protein
MQFAIGGAAFLGSPNLPNQHAPDPHFADTGSRPILLKKSVAKPRLADLSEMSWTSSRLWRSELGISTRFRG